MDLTLEIQGRISSCKMAFNIAIDIYVYFIQRENCKLLGRMLNQVLVGNHCIIQSYVIHYQ